MTQYGIRLYSNEFETVSWQEFKALLSGLNSDTPLIQIAQIRAENDKEVLKSFSKQQHDIRTKWRNKKLNNISNTEIEKALEVFKGMFLSLSK